MSNPVDTALSAPASASRAADSGWYLYGITRCQPVPRAAVEVDDRASIEVLECGSVAAIVRQVPLAEFSSDTLRARLQDTAWVEAMVRSHNQVIDAIHRWQAILPAKFGCVHGSAEGLRAALERDQDLLLAHLRRVDGCDEWAIHVYLDRVALEQRTAMEDASMQQLQQEIACARPGRAYFLQLKLANTLAEATERALNDLAEAGYDRLRRHAVAGQVYSTDHSPEDIQAEMEVLRGAFLVRRENTDVFVAELNAYAESVAGLRCESSGPWPPYSFAAPIEDTVA